MGNNKNLATSIMLLSAVVACILAGLKYLALLATNSVSIRLNFVDSCMDVVVSLVNYYATVLSFRKYKKYPHGYDKITAFAAILQVIVLLTFAYDSVTESLERINHHHTIEPSFQGMLTMFVSLLLTIVLLYCQQIVIEKTGHLIVYADRMHYMTDLLTNTSMLIYFGLLFWIGDGAMFGNFDAILAIALSVYIVFCCIKIIRSAWLTLMDRRLSWGREEFIREEILNAIDLLDVKIIASRFSGVKEYFDVVLIMHKDITLSQAQLTIFTAQKLFGENIVCQFRCEMKEL